MGEKGKNSEKNNYEAGKRGRRVESEWGGGEKWGNTVEGGTGEKKGKGGEKLGRHEK